MNDPRNHAENSVPRMERRAYIVRGRVQGVGFRAFVHQLATDLGLAGFVRNQSADVYAEVEGASETLDRFQHLVSVQPPALSRVDSVSWEALPLQHKPGFHISYST